MNIAYIDYSLKTKSLDIYVSGCDAPHCVGCHNPELWSFDVGEELIKGWLKIERYLNKFNKLINNVMIFGGEPLDQYPDDLDWLLTSLNNRKFIFNDKYDIWLFTRYKFEKVPVYIKRHCDYIKCGKYVEELKVDDNVQFGIKLVTSNQKIYKRGYDF